MSASTARHTTQNITHERQAELNLGAQTTHLTEILSIDFAKLMHSAVPEIGRAAITAIKAEAGSGLTKRMALAGNLLYTHFGLDGLKPLAAHPSDTVRGWACYLIAAAPQRTLDERLADTRALADDAHFGVREWAWIALRPALAAELESAITRLQPWTGEPSEYLRRFASEALRPRGVWCAHIKALKTAPELGLPLLEPLRADPSPYVQDSVANWLNDASKDQPDWVRQVCSRWQTGTPSPATVRICKRALRTIGA